ncbi:tRNA (guanosine(18)-2'-O)-methyltransferase TrmH [Thalassolituus sp.]|jgi:tRNA (guanosine-2'-O-)-methyltransferase|uniref:tRNA (guanosine(18)-2'-O)-methyltransferase TrmH n=1 Tax=Thalassolituus sp. TaxID=2030822 RepID=UPI00260FDC80|nr:tRNA (guanosine(18)-2'-O)-methyltransferase TrmH [uncultured Thalassolituus sp.]
MTPERYDRIRETLDKRQPDLTVITDEVYKPHNLSAIARTCDAVGIPKIHCIWPKDKYRLRTASTAGSAEWIEVQTHSEITGGIRELQSQGMKVVAAHLTDRAIDYRSYDFTQPTALLMGTEKEGVSDEASELADEHLIIPMYGMVQSFNVSVAAAIILNEACYQREKAGMYQSARLPAEWYERLLFEWCQPQISKLCRQHNLAYPALREDGELVDPQGFSRLYNEITAG